MHILTTAPETIVMTIIGLADPCFTMKVRIVTIIISNFFAGNFFTFGSMAVMYIIYLIYSHDCIYIELVYCNLPGCNKLCPKFGLLRGYCCKKHMQTTLPCSKRMWGVGGRAVDVHVAKQFWYK